MSDAPNTGAGSAPAKGGSKAWLWIIIAILIVLILPVILCVGCCGGAAMFGIGAMKSSEPYQNALSKVKAHPDAIEHLGEPIEDGAVPTNSQFNDHGDTGDAAFTFTVTGPNGTATVNTEAVKEGGVWKTTVLTLTFDDGHTHNLLSDEMPDDVTPEMDDDGAMPEDGAADGEAMPEDGGTDFGE